jgi:hypothetical protein
MDLNMLAKVSTENLQAMQAHIGAILGARLDTRIVAGRIADFTGSDGVIHTVRIDKTNQKTASCTEIDPIAGKKWRIYMNGLRVKPIERTVAHKVPVIAAPHVPHTPTGGGSAW